MRKLFPIIAISAMALSGCDSSVVWHKSDDKDAMTDNITRSYSNHSVSGTPAKIEIACSKGGKIYFYYEFPSREGIPSLMLPQTAKIRFDNEKPHDVHWNNDYASGESEPEDVDAFFKKISGKNKFTIEVFDGGKSSFDITGIDDALAGMHEVGCPKSDSE